MRSSEHTYPLTYSTAYLALAALLTLRTNADEYFDDNTIDYATDVLRMIRNQPDTVLNLSAECVNAMSEQLIDNAKTWATRE